MNDDQRTRVDRARELVNSVQMRDLNHNPPDLDTARLSLRTALGLLDEVLETREPSRGWDPLAPENMPGHPQGVPAGRSRGKGTRRQVKPAKRAEAPDLPTSD